MPPLKKLKDSASQNKCCINSSKGKAVPVLDDNGLHNEGTEQMDILSVASNPLERRTENFDALHNNIAQDAVGELRDNFRNSRIYHPQEITCDRTIAKNLISKSYCTSENDLVFSKVKDESSDCFESKKCSIVEMPLNHNTMQSTKLACLPKESRDEHMQNCTKAKRIIDSYDAVIANSGQDALSVFDGIEKKINNKPCDLSAYKSIIDSPCSSPRFVSNSQLYPSRDTQYLGNTSNCFHTTEINEIELSRLNTRSAKSPKCEEFPRLEERFSLPDDVNERSRPTSGDGTFVNKSKLDIDMKKQNHAASKSLHRQWKNTDDFLENDDIKLTVPCEPDRNKSSSRNKLPNISYTNTAPMESSMDKPKDDIKVVATIVVKILSKYHQSNRIANKVS